MHHWTKFVRIALPSAAGNLATREGRTWRIDQERREMERMYRVTHMVMEMVLLTSKLEIWPTDKVAAHQMAEHTTNC